MLSNPPFGKDCKNIREEVEAEHVRSDAGFAITNAARVLTRFFALLREQQTTSFLWTVARQVTPSGQAHLFNQAIMDLGATICVARTPRCSVCPLRRVCRSVERSKGTL